MAPSPSSRKPNLPPEPRPSEADFDATSIMNRPQIESRIRAMQQPSLKQPPAARPPPHERTQTHGGAPNRTPPNIRQTGQFGRGPVTERGGSIRDEQRPPRAPAESAGAIALPRPPVQAPPGTTRQTASGRTVPGVAPPGTVRTTSPIAARKTNSNPPQSAEPPPLDDLVPRARTDRPRHSRPPVSHRSQPPRDRARFADRSPEPRSPGGGLPGPDSFGRIPAPIQPYTAKPGDFPSPSNFPPPPATPSFPPPPSPSNFPPPDATMAMARNPYAQTPPQPRMQQTAEYYPAPTQTPQNRSYAPPPMQARDQRDPNEYYPHLAGSPSAPVRPSMGPPQGAGPSGAYSYPPPGYLPPGTPHPRSMPPPAMASGSIASVHGSAYPPAILPQDSRLLLPGSAPYPYVAPPIEHPSFMGLVLFAAPLALATLAVAALALM